LLDSRSRSLHQDSSFRSDGRQTLSNPVFGFTGIPGFQTGGWAAGFDHPAETYQTRSGKTR
jgi:hypothetical protein